MTHEQSSHNHFQANMAPPPPPEALGITLTRGHWKRSAVRKLLFFFSLFAKHCITQVTVRSWLGKNLYQSCPVSSSVAFGQAFIACSLMATRVWFSLPSHISLYLRMCSMKWANGRDPWFLEFCLMLKKAVIWWQKLESYLCLFRLAKIITLMKKVDQNCSYKYLMWCPLLEVFHYLYRGIRWNVKPTLLMMMMMMMMVMIKDCGK